MDENCFRFGGGDDVEWRRVKMPRGLTAIGTPKMLRTMAGGGVGGRRDRSAGASHVLSWCENGFLGQKNVSVVPWHLLALHTAMERLRLGKTCHCMVHGCEIRLMSMFMIPNKRNCNMNTDITL